MYNYKVYKIIFPKEQAAFVGRTRKPVPVAAQRCFHQPQKYPALNRMKRTGAKYSIQTVDSGLTIEGANDVVKYVSYHLNFRYEMLSRIDENPGAFMSLVLNRSQMMNRRSDWGSPTKRCILCGGNKPRDDNFELKKIGERKYWASRCNYCKVYYSDVPPKKQYRCSSCKVAKGYKEFSPCKSRYNGRQGYCKQCNRDRMRVLRSESRLR